MWKAIKKCENCKKWKELSEFLIREDRTPERYAFCFECMKTLNRRCDYPKVKKRGGGKIEGIEQLE